MYFFMFAKIYNCLLLIDKWAAKCLQGKKQSPINLQKDTAEYHIYSDLYFRNYDLKYDASVKNTGHSGT